ncbi:hypothetical protein [Micromonospora sonchi]|nr:hypothetical protein [Micromonospora sonchi]
MTRLPRAAALTLTALIAATLAACGSSEPDTTPSSAPASTRPAAVEVECVSAERAYNAWQTDLFVPKTADDWAEANEGQIQMAADRGKTFLDNVSGYDSQPSKELASAIAAYNMEVAFVNLQLGLHGGIDTEAATKAASALQRVEIAFRSWKSAVCS